MVTIRNNSLELEDGDTISVDGTELTFRSSGELEFPDGETAITLSDIDGADIAPNSVDANSYNESVIDHDQTTNRTHAGDDLSPATLEATEELRGATASEGDLVTLSDNPDAIPIYFDAQTGQPLVPDLEETV